MLLLRDHFVIAMCLPADIDLSPGKACGGVDLKYRERVRNRGGCDVRKFPWLRLPGWRPASLACYSEVNFDSAGEGPPFAYGVPRLSLARQKGRAAQTISVGYS